MTTTNVITPRLLQLYALRSQLEALILAEEQEVSVSGPDPQACPACGAPEDKVHEIATMDSQKHRRCLVCGHQWTA